MEITRHHLIKEIVMTNEEKNLFENMNTEHKLEEVIEWITNDCWHELSPQSKKRIIRQLGYMGYFNDDLKEMNNGKRKSKLV